MERGNGSSGVWVRQNFRIKYGGYGRTHLKSNIWAKSWGDGKATSSNFIPVIVSKYILSPCIDPNHISGHFAVVQNQISFLTLPSQFFLTYLGMQARGAFLW